MIYSLADAATYIGVPSDLLHQMAWANQGPAQEGKSYWSPVFTREALDAWLASQPTKPHIQATGKVGVWAVKRMRVRV